MRDGRPPTFHKWNAPKLVTPKFMPSFKATISINSQEKSFSVNNAEYSALERVEKANSAPLFEYKNIGLKTLESLIEKGLVSKKSTGTRHQSPFNFNLTATGRDLLARLPSR